MHGGGKWSLDFGIVFQLAKRLQSMGAILPGKSSAQRLITRVYLQSHCFDRSRELGNINRAYSVIAAALGCVCRATLKGPRFDGLQYLHREVSILILRLGHV